MKLEICDKLLKVIDKEIKVKTSFMTINGDNQSYYTGCLDMLNYIRQLLLIIKQEQ